jgi:hypothetical protein
LLTRAPFDHIQFPHTMSGLQQQTQAGDAPRLPEELPGDLRVSVTSRDGSQYNSQLNVFCKRRSVLRNKRGAPYHFTLVSTGERLTTRFYALPGCKPDADRPNEWGLLVATRSTAQCFHKPRIIVQSSLESAKGLERYNRWIVWFGRDHNHVATEWEVRRVSDSHARTSHSSGRMTHLDTWSD